MDTTTTAVPLLKVAPFLGVHNVKVVIDFAFLSLEMVV